MQVVENGLEDSWKAHRFVIGSRAGPCNRSNDHRASTSDEASASKVLTGDNLGAAWIVNRALDSRRTSPFGSS